MAALAGTHHVVVVGLVDPGPDGRRLVTILADIVGVHMRWRDFASRCAGRAGMAAHAVGDAGRMSELATDESHE